MRSLLAVLAAICSLVTVASGHGWIHRHILNGITYIGFLPENKPIFTDPAPSIVRRVGSDGPVTDIHRQTDTIPLSNDITCNFNATPIANSDGTSRVGKVTAGTNLTVYWQGWPHSGPIVTYMARCTPNCSTFTGREGAVWFKIDEFGYQIPSGDTAGSELWGTQQLDTQKYYWNVTIPACLENGEYLFRHEIIALSECKTKGKCQFYPSCAQIEVIGGAGVKPDGLVSFPGAYTDASVYWDTNTMDPKGYVMPGPKVWKCPG
ncbi:glycoside hydrolase [Pseudovirgaria hyperparasitica]|uniref:AA9 family lytic polysaccharide monooxygenase n=1 Tax=Pseudovirgaria hyperparasitica TaxID=470096 RepID=A0A6A6W2U8_9PEZI|nr:glycoside hydrolase [Pseudovirgaria hyperparasitica]KAF2756885.1 glycoside hydrolase [Pseudovirgaria hyperparasitica]